MKILLTDVNVFNPPVVVLANEGGQMVTGQISHNIATEVTAEPVIVLSSSSSKGTLPTATSSDT